MSQPPLHLSQPFGGFYQPVAQFAAQSAPAHGPLFPPPSPAHRPHLPSPSTPFRLPAVPPWEPLPPTPILPDRAPPPSPALPETPSVGKSKKDHAHFSESDKAVMCEMLLEDKANSTAQGGHKASVWQAIADRLNDQRTQGAKKDVRNLQSQHNYIRKNYWEPIYDMLTKTSGFGWDDETHRVVAEEEVWIPYLKSHPEADKWRSKSWPQFEEWNKLFEGTKAHGKNVVRPGRPFVGLGGNPRAPTDDSSDDGQGEADRVVVPETQRESREQSSSNSSAGRPRSAKRKVTSVEAAEDLRAKVTDLTQLAREAFQPSDKKKKGSAERLEEATAFVADLEWLFDDDKVKILNVLSSHREKVVLLLAVTKKRSLLEALVRSWLDE